MCSPQAGQSPGWGSPGDDALFLRATLQAEQQLGLWQPSGHGVTGRSGWGQAAEQGTQVRESIGRSGAQPPVGGAGPATWQPQSQPAGDQQGPAGGAGGPPTLRQLFHRPSVVQPPQQPGACAPAPLAVAGPHAQHQGPPCPLQQLPAGGQQQRSQTQLLSAATGTCTQPPGEANAFPRVQPQPAPAGWGLGQPEQQPQHCHGQGQVPAQPSFASRPLVAAAAPKGGPGSGCMPSLASGGAGPPPAAGGTPSAVGFPSSSLAQAVGPAGEAAPAADARPAAREAAQGPTKPKKNRQLFDYLCVYDLEATCDEEKKLQPQEIIELSCVVVNTQTLQLEGSFQRYCRPTVHPRLTDFCTGLTGISQQQVDAGVALEEALAAHTAWLKDQGLLGQGKSFVPVTWNDWDLKVMMEGECKWRNLAVPKYLRRWVDLKAVFKKHYNKSLNLRSSVEHVGLAWEGRAHSGIDDAANTARLAVKLMQSGLVLGITGSFTGVDASGRFKQSTLFAGSSRPAKKARIYDDTGKWNGKCSCGAKAKKRTAKRPGPNCGREFWSCGKYTATGGAQCDFFQWA